ncbi:MAG TPA: hypothetical protein VGA86_10370 [Desulfatiglandales bacterium]
MNHFVLKDMTPRKPAPGVEMRVISYFSFFCVDAPNLERSVLR